MDKKGKNLTGKVAVITGASQGFGESLARLYASEEATVILAARNLPAVEKIVAEISTAGFSASGYTCDVQDLSQVEELARYVIQKYGKMVFG